MQIHPRLFGEREQRRLTDLPCLARMTSKAKTKSLAQPKHVPTLLYAKKLRASLTE